MSHPSEDKVSTQPEDDMFSDCVDGGLKDGVSRPGGRSNHEPIRKCLANGSRKPQSEMIRFVLGPDNVVCPDLGLRLPGRGMWLSADAQSIKTACERRLFAKAARTKVEVPKDLDHQVHTLLARRCIEAMSLARRAGEAVTGFEKVRSLIMQGQAAVLVHASEAADEGRRKLAQVCLRASREEGHGKGRKVIEASVLTADEIGQAFGRMQAVHTAIMPGGLATRFLRDAKRLQGFRIDKTTEDRDDDVAVKPTTKDDDE